MAEIVTKITNLSYDQYLSLTSPEEWGKVAVNVEHMADTDIGYVKEVFVEKGDEVNVYAKIVLNDTVYEKIRDYITGCSVELAVVEQKDGTTLSVPTKCSMLVGSQPAINDAGKTILERVYSKIENLINKNNDGDIMKYNEKMNEIETKIMEYSEKMKKIDEIETKINEYNEKINKINELENKINELEAKIAEYSKIKLFSDNEEKGNIKGNEIIDIYL